KKIIILLGAKKFKADDFKVMIVFALLLAGISWAVLPLKNLMLAYSIITILIGFFMALTALCIRKLGSVMFFIALYSILSIGTGTIGISGMKKVVIFIVIGALFEIIFFLLRFNGDRVDALVASSVSCAAIPFSVGVILSYDLMRELFVNMLNLSLISMVLGFIGSVLAVLLWGKVRNKKFFVRLRYAP
ncbi:hypothetical protein ACFL6I_20820, partial [candidate division KSB1 bacterium]